MEMPGEAQKRRSPSSSPYAVSRKMPPLGNRAVGNSAQIKARQRLKNTVRVIYRSLSRVLKNKNRVDRQSDFEKRSMVSISKGVQRGMAALGAVFQQPVRWQGLRTEYISGES